MSEVQDGRPVLLYAIKHCDRSGAPLHVLALARHFSASYDVQLAFGNAGFLSQAFAEQGWATHAHRCFSGRINPLGFLWALWYAVALIRQVRPQLIHAHGPAAGMIWRIAAALTRVPCLITAHGWNFDRGLPWLRRVAALLPEYLLRMITTGVITVSEADRQLALRLRILPPRKLHCVLNGVPDHGARAQPGAQPPTLIMVARFSAQKDQLSLVRALAGLQGLSWKMQFVGVGETLGPVQQEVERLGLSQRVVFSLESNQVSRCLAQAQVFALVSHYEGLPLAVLEAMAAGLPVIASDVGGMAEAVMHGKTGYLVPAGDEAALIQALKSLISDTRRREQFGQAGRQRFERDFSEAEMLSSTACLYRACLRSRGGTCAAD